MTAERLEQLADTIHDGQARLVLVDDGRQPEPRGRAHGAGDHQPRADDRQHRPPRHRRQLDHRPVQRDGLAAVQQHDQPARRPRLHQRRRTARRSPASSASTTARIPTRGQPGLRPDHRGHPRRQDQGPLGHRHQPGALVDQPGRRSASVLGRLDFLVVQDMYATTETAQRADLVLPAAGWGEKEGTFINSERRIGLHQEGRARARRRRWPTSTSSSSIAEAWGCGDMFARVDSPRGGLPDPQGLSRGQPCDITGIADYAMLDDARRHPVAAARAARRRAGSRAPAVRGRPLLPRPTAGRASSSRRRAPMPEPTDDELPVRCCSPAAAARASGTPRPARRSRRCCASCTRASPTSRSTRPTRARCGIAPQRVGRRRVAPRRACGPAPSSTHAVQPGPGVHPDALRRHQPADASPRSTRYSRQPAYKHCAVRVRRDNDAPA